MKKILLLLVLLTTFACYKIQKDAEQAQNDFIHSAVGENVVSIMDVDKVRGGSTGFFVNTPGGNTFILTNNHVCGLANSGGALLIDSEYIATVVAHSLDHDLCIVSNPMNYDGINLAKDSRDGEDIFVVGHPLLEPLALVKGEIAGTMQVDIRMGYNLPCTDAGEKKIEMDPESMSAMFGIQSVCIRNYEAQATTANILPGNSGSPVVNIKGEVVGVVFADREDGPGRGYIVPLSYVQKFLSDK